MSVFIRERHVCDQCGREHVYEYEERYDWEPPEGATDELQHWLSMQWYHPVAQTKIDAWFCSPACASAWLAHRAGGMGER